MPFPTNWPPRQASTKPSLRVYLTGTATTDFSDNGFNFADVSTSITHTPMPKITRAIRASATAVTNLGSGPYGGGQNDDNPTAPMAWARGIKITNLDATNNLEFSFDGTNVHGIVPPNTSEFYDHRYEAGIAVRSAAATVAFRVNAW